MADLGKQRFRLAQGPYGDGVPVADGRGQKALKLVPFRSIATDPKLIPTGSVLYIAAARGLKFTDTAGKRRTHDGYFLAADIGPAIQGEHIDVFSGLSMRNPFPGLIHSEPGGSFTAQVMQNEVIRRFLLGLHTAE